MEDTAQSVCDLNVARFVEKLWSEHDPDMRVSLKQLLIEEEDKFGRRTERLSNFQRYIVELHHSNLLFEDLGPAVTTFVWLKGHLVT